MPELLIPRDAAACTLLLGAGVWSEPFHRARITAAFLNSQLPASAAQQINRNTTAI